MTMIRPANATCVSCSCSPRWRYVYFSMNCGIAIFVWNLWGYGSGFLVLRSSLIFLDRTSKYLCGGNSSSRAEAAILGLDDCGGGGLSAALAAFLAWKKLTVTQRSDSEV